MMAGARDPAAVLRYVGWVLIWSLPFYAWGLLWPVGGLPFGLPATVVMVVVPALVATASTWRERRGPGVRALWRQAFVWPGGVRRRWVALALLVMPLASVLAYVAMRATGLPLPALAPLDPVQVLLALGLFALGALLEEIGWTAYATPALQRRYGVFAAGCVLGAAWAAWHVVPWAFHQGHAPGWVIAQSLVTVATRVIMGWIYVEGGRSLLLAIGFHTMINAAYALFPNGGSAYDPGVMAIILWLGVGVIALRGLVRRQVN